MACSWIISNNPFCQVFNKYLLIKKIDFANIYLLIGMFYLFRFNVITNKIIFMLVILLFSIFLFFFCSSISPLLLFVLNRCFLMYHVTLLVVSFTIFFYDKSNFKLTVKNMILYENHLNGLI